jgi:hypothetical protein
MREAHLGVALTKCYFCQGNNEIIINKLLSKSMKENVEEMHGKIVNMHPCPKCKDMMKRGIILITIDNAKSEPGWSKPKSTYHNGKEYPGMPNPYRTGGFFVITDDGMRRCLGDLPAVDWAIKHRFMFIEHAEAEKIGLFSVTPTETNRSET